MSGANAESVYIQIMDASKKQISESVSRSGGHFYIYTFGWHLKGTFLFYLISVINHTHDIGVASAMLPIITGTCSLIGHM